MALRNRHARSALNYWPALLDVVTAAFMVFVLATYLQLVMTMDITSDASDIEAARIRELESQFVARLRSDLGW